MTLQKTFFSQEYVVLRICNQFAQSRLSIFCSKSYLFPPTKHYTISTSQTPSKMELFSGSLFIVNYTKILQKKEIENISGSGQVRFCLSRFMSGQVQVQPDLANSGQVRFEHFQAFFTLYLYVVGHFFVSTVF